MRLGRLRRTRGLLRITEKGDSVRSRCPREGGTQWRPLQYTGLPSGNDDFQKVSDETGASWKRSIPKLRKALAGISAWVTSMLRQRSRRALRPNDGRYSARRDQYRADGRRTAESENMVHAVAEYWCDWRSRPQHRRRVRAGRRCASADGASAALPVVAPRGVVAYAAHERLAADAVSAQASGSMPSSNDARSAVAGVKWACPIRGAWRKASAAARRKSSGSTGSEFRGRLRLHVGNAPGPEHRVAIHRAPDGNYTEGDAAIGSRPLSRTSAEEQNGTNVTGVKTALQLIGETRGRR